MADKDIGGAVFARFDAGDEFIALAGGIHAAEAYFFKDTAQAVLRDFGAVFRPVGFHLADGRLFRADVETVFLPEYFQQRPDFGRGFTVDHKPALAAFALHVHAFHALQHGLIGGLLHGGGAVDVAGAHGAGASGNLIAVALVGVG